MSKIKKHSYTAKEKRSSEPIIVSLLLDKKIAEHITRSSCWRPDIYLNNDKFCNGCIIYENCFCPIKRIDKKHSADSLIPTKKNSEKRN